MGIVLWILLCVLILIVLLAIVVLARTFAFKPPRAPAEAKNLDVGEVDEAVLARLGKAISIPTIAGQDYKDTDFAPFDEYIAFIQEAFPLFHKTCTLTRINTYGLVYLWQGSDKSLDPMMLTAHYDVVPVEAGTEDEWKYPGFSGQVAEGRLWGRGTLDIKSQMIAQMEAAENLMRAGFTPTRGFYFVYGHDEEVGGRQGAYKIAEYFKENGVRLEGVLDEGGVAVTGVIKSIKAPLAMIGIAEKGFCNYELTLPGAGGHSSMPPPHTALGEMAQLLCRIEDNPLPPRLTPPALEMIRNISGEMGFVVRMAVANLWLFRPILLKVLTASPTTNSMVRTTFAATMAKASDAANVLPQRASATVNVRLLPGDTTEGVGQYFKRLAHGKDVTVTRLVAEEPSAVSPTDSAVYRRVADQILKIWPGVITTPYLVMGGTDARKYYGVCDNVLRFTPALITSEEKDTMHNTNESITIENYGRMIAFFEQFIEGFD